jgi:hypothetical protein
MAKELHFVLSTGEMSNPNSLPNPQKRGRLDKRWGFGYDFRERSIALEYRKPKFFWDHTLGDSNGLAFGQHPEDASRFTCAKVSSSLNSSYPSWRKYVGHD